MSTVIENEDGTQEKVLDDDCDVTSKAVQEMTQIFMPAMKEALGESVAQSMKDIFEASQEAIAKAQELNEPVNRTNHRQVITLDEKALKADRQDVLQEYMKFIGQTKGNVELAHANAERAGARSEVIKALSATVEDSLGALVPDSVMAGLVELRQNASVIREIAPTPITITGNLRIPKDGTEATAFWKGESEDLTPSSVSVTEDHIYPKKLTVLLVASNELLQDGVNVNGYITRKMRRAYRQEEEPTFLRSDGTVNKPKGIKQHLIAANKTARTAAGGAGTSTTSEIFKDLIEMFRKLKAANHDVTAEDAIFVLNSNIWAGLMNKLGGTDQTKFFLPEVMAGRILGIPFRETNYIPNNLDPAGTGSELYLLLRSYIMIADSDEMRLDASKDASYLESGSLKSAWSRDETAFRLIGRTDMHYEYSDGGVMLDNVDWHLA